MDPVVVTGTRTERLSRESPVRTEVVTQEQIEMRHARDLKEALQYLPGLQLREIHGKSGYEVWIQGLNADRVLILVDGMPVSPTTGSSVDVTQLSLLDVDRVEVVKGATSAQYGSAAMGGVVNLITSPIPLGRSANAVLDSGTYGDQNPSGDALKPSTLHGRVRAGVGGGQWRLRVAADRNQSDGIDPDPDSWARPGNEVKRTTIDGRLEWHDTADRGLGYFNVGQFTEISEARFMGDSNADNLYERQSKDEDLSRLRLAGGMRWQHANGVGWAVDVLSEEQADDTLKRNATLLYDFDDRESDYQIERYNTRLELPSWQGHLWMLGLDFSRETLSQFKDGSSELATAGGKVVEEVERDGPELFVQDDWFMGDRVELLLGARYQRDSDFGSHFSPKLNVRYQWLDSAKQDVFVRLGWGNGYRVPNLKERYYIFDHSQLGYMVLGNRDLRPESSSSWQAGIGALLNQNLTLDLNLFYNDLEDLIQTEFDHYANRIAFYHYVNVAKSKTRGLEITAAWSPVNDLDLNAGYTFLKSENNDIGGELTRRPRHQISAGVDWRMRTLAASAGVLIRGQSDELADSASGARSPGWVVCDLKLNYDLSPGLRLLGGIDNLFDRQRDFTRGFDFAPVEGRYFYMGVRWQWAQND